MFLQNQGQQKLHLWADIDDPSTTRIKMHKSLIMRREQMVGDGLQLTFDAPWPRPGPSSQSQLATEFWSLRYQFLMITPKISLNDSFNAPD